LTDYTLSVSLAGTPLSKEVMDNIVSVDVLESLDELTAISVTFTVPRTAEMASLLTQFLPGQALSLSIARGTAAPATFHGDLIDVRHRQGGGRAWTATLRALDRLHLLGKRPRTRVWEGSPSIIVETIGREHGLQVVAEAVTATTDYTFQANVPDAVFLKRLAAMNNYYLHLEGQTLRFGRRNLPYNATTLVTFGEEVVSLDVNLSLRDQVTQVTALGWDYVTNQPVVGLATSTQLRNISGGETGVARAVMVFGEVKLVLDNLPFRTQSEATAAATAALQARAERYVTGRVVGRGDPLALCGGLMTLSDSDAFDGDYLIRQIRHEVRQGGGFQTTLEFFSDSMPDTTSVTR